MKISMYKDTKHTIAHIKSLTILVSNQSQHLNISVMLLCNFHGVCAVICGSDFSFATSCGKIKLEITALSVSYEGNWSNSNWQLLTSVLLCSHGLNATVMRCKMWSLICGSSLAVYSYYNCFSEQIYCWTWTVTVTTVIEFYSIGL